MNYDVSLSKTKVILMIVAFFILAVLIFATGWICGQMMTRSPAVSDTAASADSAKTSARNIVPRSVKSDANPPEKPSPKAEKSQPADDRKNADDKTGKDAKTAESQDAKSGMLYSVEADSFVVRSKAAEMVKKLTSKGYKAEILKIRSPEDANSSLYAVLIGVHEDQKKASDAASEFGKKEGIAAVVKPIAASVLEESRKSSAPPGIPQSGENKAKGN